MPLTLDAQAMIESAVSAANLRPRGDPPACTSAGRPCGHGAVFKGPRHLKNLPSKLIGRTLR